MSLEELSFYALMAIGLSSVMVSLYLWFVCKARTGMLLWSSYALRAACGVFFLACSVFVWGVLYGEIRTGEVVSFVGIFAVLGLSCVTPRGLTQRVLAKPR